MNIGDAANRSGVSAKMIRYYERIGLIPTASRTASGYREYEPRDVHMLRFIARARDLGFSVAAITELLDLWRDKDRASAEVKRIALDHVAELEVKIAEMRAMSDTLQELADACQGDHRPDCPILRDLENSAPRLARGNSRLPFEGVAGANQAP